MNDIKIPWPEWKAVRRIGNGSFGSVYEIERQDGFGHTEKAALKVISIPKEESEIDSLMANGYDANSITEYFRTSLNNIMNEYAMMAALKGHSNIVSCEDRTAVKQANGIGWDVYIRMELLTPFIRSITGKTISENSVIKVGIDLSYALMACHQVKIIHRDIKPENIFVTKYGDYKLGDFGVARIMSHTTSATKTGTPYYMAPEVCKEEKYGKEADIYSLGMVLYWLLNNRRLPFEPVDRLPSGDEKEKAYKDRLSGREIPDPLNGSPELKKVIRKALAYDQKNRYRSAEKMLSDLMEADSNYQHQIFSSMPDIGQQQNNDESYLHDQDIKQADLYTHNGTNAWTDENGTIGRQNSPNSKEDDYEIAPFGMGTFRPGSNTGGKSYREQTDFLYSDDRYSKETSRKYKNSRSYRDEVPASNINSSRQSRSWMKYLLLVLALVIIKPTVNLLNKKTASTEDQTETQNSAAVEETTEKADSSAEVTEVKNNNTVIAAGDNSYEQCNISDWENIISVSAGNYHSIGLKTDGTVIAAGTNGYGQCDVSKWNSIAAVAAGDLVTIGLKTDGTVVAAGYSQFGQCDVSNWKNIAQIAASSGMTVGLKTDGTVEATGYNPYGYFDFTGWSNIKYVASSADLVIGVKTDGTVISTGYDPSDDYDFSAWNNIKSVAAGEDVVIGLKPDGTVVATGWNADQKYDVTGWSNITQIAAGMHFVIGLKTDGTVVTAGNYQSVQDNVTDWNNIITISAGSRHVIGLKSN